MDQYFLRATLDTGDAIYFLILFLFPKPTHFGIVLSGVSPKNDGCWLWIQVIRKVASSLKAKMRFIQWAK